MNQTTSTTYSFSAIPTSSETVAPRLFNLGCLYSLKRRELHTTEIELTKKKKIINKWVNIFFFEKKKN